MSIKIVIDFNEYKDIRDTDVFMFLFNQLHSIKKEAVFIKTFFKKCSISSLPTQAVFGTPYLCTSNMQLYIGQGYNKPMKKIGIIDPIDMESVSDYYEKLFNNKIEKLFNNMKPDEKNQIKSGLEPNEYNVMRLLNEAIECYNKLPVMRKQDLSDFTMGIYNLQSMLALRQMRRLYPGFWDIGVMKKK